MINNIRNISSKPFIFFKNNIALDVNKEFFYLTGFSKKDIIGKTKQEIKNILRISSHLNFDTINKELNCYLFTNKCEPREVIISIFEFSCFNDCIYYFKEKKHTRIENIMPFVAKLFCENEIGVAICSISHGKHSILLKLNSKFTKLCNMLAPVSNYIGRDCAQIFPHITYKYYNYISCIINNNKTFHLKEIKYTTPSNKDRYLDINFVPISINSKVKYLVQTITDVTERVVSREIIEKQKRELEAIIENISEELIIFNKYGDYIKLNKAARENAIFDYRICKNIEDSYKQVEVTDMEGNKLLLNDYPLKKVLKGEKISNIRIIRKNNEITQYREISGTPIYDNDWNLTAAVLVMRDFSDRLKYEENLFIKAQYESLKSIIENLEFSLIRLTVPDLRFKDINSKAYNLYKACNLKVIPQESLIGTRILDYFVNNDFIDEINNCIKDNKISHKKIKLNIRGQELSYKFIIQPLCGLNNEIIEILIIGIDITEEENAKFILENTLKMQDEIYSNVSHELKTPINVIFSANQIMDMYLNNDIFDKDKYKSYNDSIKLNCYRLIKLVNNIVDLSKSEAGHFELNLCNENIVEVVENIVDSVSDYVKLKKLTIIFDTDVEEKVIACDPNLIERVMLNLISNSIKFSDPDSCIYVNIKDKDKAIEISVKDEGIGISEENMESLFDRFYRVDNSLSRNTEGTGIGLSLIKSIVEQHGGSVSVESKLGHGSIFKFELPVRTCSNPAPNDFYKYTDNKIEKINIEFSDIYTNE
jgi:signal transduction histidine kinase